MTLDGKADATSAEAQLRDFIAKFNPAHQKMIRAARRKMGGRFPSAYQLVYDNYNFFVIGFSPTTKPSHAVISITANSSGLGLCFIRGASLPDPHKILVGTGNQTRFVRLPHLEVLDAPPVVRLLDEAEAQSTVPFSVREPGHLIIQSVSAKQRPRRTP